MPDDVPMVMYYMGRRVDEMSHADLLEAFIDLAQQHDAMLQDNLRRIRRSADLFRNS